MERKYCWVFQKQIFWALYAGNEFLLIQKFEKYIFLQDRLKKSCFFAKDFAMQCVCDSASTVKRNVPRSLQLQLTGQPRLKAQISALSCNQCNGYRFFFLFALVHGIYYAKCGKIFFAVYTVNNNFMKYVHSDKKHSPHVENKGKLLLKISCVFHYVFGTAVVLFASG